MKLICPLIIIRIASDGVILAQQIHNDILKEFKILHTMSILNNKFSITITDSWKMTIDEIKFAYNSHILVDLYLTQGYVLQISKS